MLFNIYTLHVIIAIYIYIYNIYIYTYIIVYNFRIDVKTNTNRYILRYLHAPLEKLLITKGNKKNKIQ